MKRATINRRNAVLKQLEARGLTLSSQDPIRLNYGVLRAMRAGCFFALALIACQSVRAAVPVDDTGLLVSYCIYAESRGEGWEGMRAAASVIYNRHRYKARSLKYVVLRRGQFESMTGIRSGSDVPRSFRTGNLKSGDRAARDYCLSIYAQMGRGRFNPDGYWTHFYSPAKCSPAWGELLYDVDTIGDHRFGVMPRGQW